MGTTRRHAALGIAAGGVLAGHWLTYVLVDPNAHQRATELAVTGHAYLGLANDLGLLGALIACSAIFLGGLTDGVPNGEHAVRSLGALIVRLVTFQVVAFTSMEVLERISAGAPVAGVLQHVILPVGIGVQAALASLCALAVRWLLRAARHVGSALGAAPALPHRAAAAPLPLPTFHAPPRRALRVSGIRGPPCLASPR